jgi:hypothetical protein
MRFRIPGRTLAFGVLLALLCLALPVGQHVAIAKPIGWDNQTPPPPNGDNDGVVVKAARFSVTGYTPSSSATSVTVSKPVMIPGGYRGLFALVRLGYWRLLIW